MFLVLFVWIPVCPAQSTLPPESAPEPAVKAAVLLKILPFVQWPTNTFATNNSPLVIAVVDAPEILAQLQKISVGQSISGHPLVLRRPTDADWSDVHVLFVGREHRRGLVDLADNIKDRPVLTIGEQTGFAESGGIVNLLIKQQRASLEISRESAERVGLRFSSNLGALRSIRWVMRPEGP